MLHLVRQEVCFLKLVRLQLEHLFGYLPDRFSVDVDISGYFPQRTSWVTFQPCFKFVAYSEGIGSSWSACSWTVG